MSSGVARNVDEGGGLETGERCDPQYGAGPAQADAVRPEEPSASHARYASQPGVVADVIEQLHGL
jgi:hypothetical protein